MSQKASMLLTKSIKRKVAVTCGAVLGFVLFYEARSLDSKYAARLAVLREDTAPAAPGARLRFYATAYCKGSVTASGVGVRSGIAASDPRILPSGSVIQIDSLAPPYNGIYTIMDNGPAVKGRELDLYMWSCHEALRFGRRSVQLTVLRLGWNPQDTTPERSALEQFFRDADRPAPIKGRPLLGSGASTPAPQTTRPPESPRQ